ncbi:MAG: hypothetical protein CMJ46_06455 [Planctomyces sp.]|nr:hypothetical protein [Planctomyces sp.]
MSPSQFQELPDKMMVLVNKLCNHFEKSWQANKRPQAEAYLKKVPEEVRPILLQELIPIEVDYRERNGEEINLSELVARFPGSDRASLEELLDTRVVHQTELMPATSSGQVYAEATPPEELGDYRILEKLGRGGMGTVFKAIHKRMDRVVALKILHPQIQADAEFQKRFDREVRTAASLNHPHIVTALDAREDEGLLYFVTEYIKGSDLQSYVANHGPLPLLTAVDCILQTAQGLEYAHGLGIIHRDIKPANLLRDEQGTIKILDMGLARLISAANEEREENSALTSTGLVMGTVTYMSPEQARSTRDAGPASDVYSLGCTLFYLLHGRPPFLGRTAVETILSHANEPIPRLLDAPSLNIEGSLRREFERLFQRMLAKDEAKRIGTMQELIVELDRLQSRVAAIETETEVIAYSSASHNEISKGTKTLLASLVIFVFAASMIGFLYWRSQNGDGESMVDADPPATVRPAVVEASAASARPVATTTTAGYPGLSFNGNSSYVEIDDFPAPAEGPVTVEATVNVRTYQTANVVTLTGDRMTALFLSGDGRWGFARLEGTTSQLIQATEPAELNTTTHLAGIWTGEELRLFINGRQAETTPLEFELPPQTTPALYIGGCRPGALPHERFVNGDISRVRISTAAVHTSDYEIPAHLEPIDETIGLYLNSPVEGTTVTNVVDPDQYRGQIVNATPTVLSSEP